MDAHHSPGTSNPQLLALSLGRQFAWAEEMRRQFVASVSENPARALDPASQSFMYLSLWLSLLYSVVEALRHAGGPLPGGATEQLLSGLRQFRNTIFHVGAAFPAFLTSSEVAKDIDRLHDNTAAAISELARH
jgi:hypothetical protein